MFYTHVTPSPSSCILSRMLIKELIPVAVDPIIEIGPVKGMWGQGQIENYLPTEQLAFPGMDQGLSTCME